MKIHLFLNVVYPCEDDGVGNVNHHGGDDATLNVVSLILLAFNLNEQGMQRLEHTTPGDSRADIKVS